MSLRLLALDVDGTITDPKGEIRPEVRDAVHRARDAGLAIVPCTGRRYRTLEPVLEALSIEGDVVVQNGVLVKDAASAETLRSLYLDLEVGAAALEAMSEAGPPLFYVDQHDRGLDILTPRRSDAGLEPHAFQRTYLDTAAAFTRVLDGARSALEEGRIMMISWMADTETLEGLRGGLEAALGGNARTNLIKNVNFGGSILEVCDATSGKWPALQWVAERLGVADDEIAAVGDDHNDLEMIREAGVGIAMGHAPEAVQAVAQRVTASNGESGLAHAIDEWVLGDGH